MAAPPGEKRQRGGQPTYTKEVGDVICGRLAEGESLLEICRTKGMPPSSTVREWVLDDRGPGFAAQYARARELQAEYWADQIVAISDDSAADTVARGDEVVVNMENVNRSRLRVDSRKWLLSKLRPGTYGDKLQHANAAGDGDVTVQVVRFSKDEKSET